MRMRVFMVVCSSFGRKVCSEVFELTDFSDSESEHLRRSSSRADVSSGWEFGRLGEVIPFLRLESQDSDSQSAGGSGFYFLGYNDTGRVQ